ncbi:MAG: hypothetical protein GAK29_01894 [Acinetobacter bereziniae]|uniref:Uncharacterized protein n=1 Tax=Acinetobacter bereziniae TaxID=106648 RepID=A0A833URF9_ACIBZ|nr:MAG: hypothetical protein GAK29_01894 [Acinetobacter bereziniae]
MLSKNRNVWVNHDPYITGRQYRNGDYFACGAVNLT